jgi:hypothetical protein
MPPTEALIGADWSRFRSVNGKETVANRPFAFPLAVGKTWEVDYTEDNPNREHKREHVHHVYRVIGWEDVTVPAATFHAIKVEAEGTWTAVVPAAIAAVAGSKLDAQGATTVTQSARTGERTATGRTYKAFWYVPAVKRLVKSVEEYYDNNGVRNERYTNELVSFSVAN